MFSSEWRFEKESFMSSTFFLGVLIRSEILTPRWISAALALFCRVEAGLSVRIVSSVGEIFSVKASSIPSSESIASVSYTH